MAGKSLSGDGGYLDVEFLAGQRKNRVKVQVRRRDLDNYQPNQTVVIIRDDSPDARYEYCLLDDYLSAHRRAKNMQQVGLWLGTVLPVIFLFWFWMRRSRQKSNAHEL